jgi:ankyrin repeat protein
LDSGASVDSVNKNREAALHRAAIGGHLEIVKSLVYAGCNLNAQTTFSETALQLATENEEWEIVKLLVDCGADVNIKRTDGWAPLYTAAWQVGFGFFSVLLIFFFNFVFFI